MTLFITRLFFVYLFQVTRSFLHTFFSSGYGMTEMTVASHLHDVTDKIQIGSVGLLLPNLECKVSHDWYVTVQSSD